MSELKHLNETDKDILQQFIDNPQLVSAVKKVLLSAIYFEGTLNVDSTRNFLLAFADGHKNDAELGQLVKARAEAVKLLEEGFNKLARFKTVGKPKENNLNQAR